MVGTLNRIGMLITTPGQGTITASALMSNRFNTPAEAGAVNGQQYYMILEEGLDYEIFIGTWTLSGTTFSRDTVLMSKIAGVKSTTKMNLNGNATLRAVAPAELYATLFTAAGGTLTGYLSLHADPSSPMHAVTKQYADALLAANDALVMKAGINCSGNPNYPAADAGWTYKVTVAGKIGGASGPNVEVGDTIICTVDSSASGNHATIGANWIILQNNIDGFATAARDQINAASGKTTPVDADVFGGLDSASSNALVKFTWANIKTTLIAAFKASAAAIWAGTSDILFLTPKNAADAVVWQTLTSSTAIATNCANGQNFFVTLAHNTTFGAPSNPVDGATYQWLIQQDGTGSRTGAFNAAFEFAAAPTLSTAAGKRDLIVATYHAASGKFIASFRKGS